MLMEEDIRLLKRLTFHTMNDLTEKDLLGVPECQKLLQQQEKVRKKYR